MNEGRSIELANLMADLLVDKANGSHASVIDELLAHGVTRDELVYDLNFPCPDVDARVEASDG